MNNEKIIKSLYKVSLVYKRPILLDKLVYVLKF